MMTEVSALENVAPKVIVLDNDPFSDVGEYLEILPDPNSEYSPFEIVLPEWANRWSSVDEPTLNLGYVNSPYWLRLNIDASASIYKQWDMIVSTAMLDYIDLYQVFPDTGPRLVYRSGTRRAFSNREEDHRYFIVPLEIYNQPSEPTSFLIRIETEGSFYVPVQLYPANDFWAPLQKADVVNWMFYGVILAMALYNLFLFATVRDVSYLYYVLFITTFACLHLSLDGYIFQHVWPESMAYSPIPDTLLSAGSLIFGLLFITYFLNLKSELPLLNRIIQVMIGIMLAVIALALYYPGLPIDSWTVPLMGTLLLMAVLIGVYAAFKGLVTARYFTLAWVVFAVGNLYLVLVLTGTNLLPVPPLMVSKAAAFAEAMLLSFALAHRIRVLREERQKQQLKAEAQSYFLAQISHEIRTPLNGVLGTVDLLDQTQLDEEQKKYIETIQSSGKSLLNLVNDVLDYSRIEAGKMTVVEEQIHIQDLFRHQVELFRAQANQKSLNFKLTIDPNVPEWILSDAQRIRQIATNLISNAIKFTDQGQVVVSLSSTRRNGHPYLSIQVRDTGIGIASHEIAHLFDAYQQVDVGKRRVYGGTGLGLAISQQLVDLLGGTITVQSQQNQGSEFTVQLPLKTRTLSAPPTANVETALSRSLSILVAEDNVVNQKVIEGLLVKLGHSVTVVPEGGQSVSERMNPEASYDLILMDCEMPKMDGYEATKLIRQYEKANALPQIPIVALTAHALDDVRRRCLKCGMNDFLTKPINTQQLIRTMNHLFV
ncbi:probable two-component sensor [Reinekea sp. MED297]|uniref:histidine kinase n=2 Tax=Reinekea TaxID=230494 RepID=A4BD77_9GAMM|nr:probable two-component sensor [Reinekea sp. MED297] [Reinekea blandensis MED297]